LKYWVSVLKVELGFMCFEVCFNVGMGGLTDEIENMVNCGWLREKNKIYEYCMWIYNDCLVKISYAELRKSLWW